MKLPATGRRPSGNVELATPKRFSPVLTTSEANGNGPPPKAVARCGDAARQAVDVRRGGA
ncbi:MAG: hypothetical protein IPO18_04805 [bacterium]|nr:hypothetical protein [bacterium]